MHDHQQIVERDDGKYQIGLIEAAGPFESRGHAQAIAHTIAVAKQLSERMRAPAVSRNGLPK